jgi:hypothetical protein
MWWILGGVYVALAALMLWFLYRSASFPGTAGDDRANPAPPKKRKPRSHHKFAAP